MKSKSLKFTLVCAFIISISWNPSAQARVVFDVQQDTILNMSSKEFELSKITVTATRAERSIFLVPRALDIINFENFKRTAKALSLDESLRRIPGVIVNNRYNISQGDRIMIRGIGSRAQFGVRGIKVILDGIPLTMADGQTQLNNVDLSSVGTIEIIRGPSSSLYGNAAGGVINIRSQQTWDNELQVQPSLIIGSDGYHKFQVKLGGKKDYFDYLINMNRVKLKGFREHSASLFRVFNSIGHYQYSERTRITGLFNLFDAPYLLNPSSLDKSTSLSQPESARSFIKSQGAGKKVRQGQGGLTINHVMRSGHSIDVTLYGLWREMFNPIPGRIIDLGRNGIGSRFTFNYISSSDSPISRWTVGFDYEIQNDKRKEFENDGITGSQIGLIRDEDILDSVQKGTQLIDQEEKVSGIGPFIELEYELNPRLSFTIGARFDRYDFEVKDKFVNGNEDNSGSRKMQQVSPMASLLYKIDDLSSAYANVATAFQSPTTTELGNRQTSEGGFNPGLQPEEIRSFEIGLKGYIPKYFLLYDIAGYISRINEMLIPFQIEDPSSEEVFFRNAGEARNSGIEFRLQWDQLEWIQASIAYTHMNFKFEDFRLECPDGTCQLKGNKIPGVPPSNLFLDATFSHPSGFYGSAELKWTDEFFANDFNGDPADSEADKSQYLNGSYFTLDVRLGTSLEYPSFTANIFLGVDNLFGERYNSSVVPNAFGGRFFEPAPGRTWYAGIMVPISVK